ncbi:MAG: AI-2E family transporter [Bacteroidia bacterium]
MRNRNRIILIVFIIVLAGVAAWFLKTVLIYLLVALVLSLVGSPVRHFLNTRKIGRFRVPHGLSAFLALLSIYALIAGLIAIFIPLALNEYRILSNTKSEMLLASLQGPMSGIDHFVSRYTPQPFSTEQTLKEYLPNLFNMGQLGSVANSFVGFTGSMFVAFFAISFFTFFFLKDGKLIFETLLLISPPSAEENIRHVAHECKRLLTKYFTGLCLDSCCVATIVSAGMYLMGVSNALLIGLFAGLVNVIPYVGVFIAAAFGLFVALSTGLPADFQNALFPMILKVLSVFIATNLIDGIILQPLIFSNTVKAHPMEIFTIILVSGTLGGVGPMILAVPTYTVVRVIAKQFFSRFRIVQRLTSELED